MADWYVSSAAYALIAQFAVSGVYTVGQIVRPLTAPVTGKVHAFRCTIPGTAGAEPAWPTANNGTVTTGGATFTNVTGQSAYGWGAAAGDLYSLSQSPGWNRPVVGDRVFLSSDHAESLSSAVNWIYSFNGGSNGFGAIEFISVNRAGSVPPVNADILSGAAITLNLSASNANLIMDSFCSNFWQGITFTISGSTTGGFLIGYQGNKSSYFKNCKIVLSPSSTAAISSAGGVKCIFDNTTVQFGNVGQYIGNSSSASPFDFTWINTPSAISGTAPTSLFSFSGNTANLFTCRGIDISAVTGALLNVSTAIGSGSKVLLDSCRIAAAATRMSAQGASSSTGDEIELVNCYDGSNVINERHTAAGDLTTDRSTYLSSGAQDDIGNYSLKLVSSSRSDFAAMPFDAFVSDVENTVTGASKMATVEIVSPGTLNNTDIRLLLEYMGVVPPVTWNPADLTGITLSNGNLTAASTAAAANVRTSNSYASGKYYFECTMTTCANANCCFGIASASAALGSIYLSTGASVLNKSGNIYTNGTLQGSVAPLSNGQVICVAVDIGNSLIWFRVGTGAWIGGGNPAAGTGGFSISAISAPFCATWATNASGDQGTINVGGSSFAGAVPSGFTAGLPTVPVPNLAGFSDSLSSVLTPAAALPSSSNTWTVGGSIMTWNPSDTNNPAWIAYSNGNLTVIASNGTVGTRATYGVSAGKFYWETKINVNSGGSYHAVGVALASALMNYTGNSTGMAIAVDSGISVNNTTPTGSPTIGALGTNTIGMAIDLGAKLIWFRIAPSGNWNGSGTANPATGAGGVDISSIVTGSLLYPLVELQATDSMTANFGSSAFTGAVPSGFTAGFPPTNKQLLQVTFTPQRAGRVRGLVRLGKPSTTVWVNPQIAIA